MEWSETFGAAHEPSLQQVAAYVGTPLWDDLAGFLQQTYKVQPKLAHSNCTMQNGYFKGWNVKYKKGGKALCTLYPKQGYFVALIAIGAKEMQEAELLMPLCSAYTQNLYSGAAFGAGIKSLAMDVTDEEILRDVQNLIALRVPARVTAGRAKT